MNKYNVLLGIPARNEEKTLPLCISSLNKAVNVTSLIKKCRTIICVNGCTDKTQEIAESLVLKYPVLKIQVIKSKEGMFEAEKKIVKMAKENEIIIFLDADTQVDQKALSLILNQFKKHKELMVVGGHPIPLPDTNINLLGKLLVKILNFRAYYPQAQISVHDVKKYHPLANIDPQIMINPEQEKRSKIFFHGRFFATRGKFLWKQALKEDRIGEDTFLTQYILNNFPPGAIRVIYDANCFFEPIKSLGHHWRTYKRIFIDLKQLEKDHPEWQSTIELTKTKIDLSFVLSLPIKEKLCGILYFLLNETEQFLYKFFYKCGVIKLEEKVW